MTNVQDGQDAFWTYVYVQDNGDGIDRVQFPIWTAANGQDDLIKNWRTDSTAKGEKGTWTVNGAVYNYRYHTYTSSHNNEHGEYYTHAYAFDKYGGYSFIAGNFKFTYEITINHYQQNVSGSGYTLVATDKITGNYDSIVSPTVNTYTGFTSPATKNITVPVGGTTVSYYYSRNQYTVTIDSDSGIAAASGAGTYYYGAPVTVSINVKDGYKLETASSSNADISNPYRKGDIEGKVISRFKIGTVFDIGQTTFPPEDYPKLFSVGYPSELHEDLCKGVADFAKDVIHCDVKYEDLSSATLRGFYSRDLNQIVINSSLKGTQKLSTLCHELGHALRHNTVSKLSTHGKELEADAVSVMIESGLGLELTDARKDHLADHYRDFKAEIKQELGKDFTDEAMIQKIDDMLSSVYSTYNDIVEDLNKSIEKYVPQERLLEYQKNNEVSHEQLPKKDIDVAPEMDMDYDLEM